MADVTVSRRGADRVRAGHPWIYRSDVASADAAPGDLVLVKSERGRPLGWALWSATSQIAIRMVSTHKNVDDRTLWRERIAAAMAYRETLGLDGTACRLVHGEADGLPALVVDRYDDVLVIQTLCQGVDRRKAAIVDALVELVKPRGILARNDQKVRRLESLDESIEVLYGEVPDTVRVREGRIWHDVDLRHGQKTGLFLDQSENHLAAARYARGQALDAFAYHGGFALQMAAGGAAHVLALDASEAAVAATAESARKNGLTNVEARAVNVFDELREFEIARTRFDTIVLDPPAFAKNKAALQGAVAGYKEINLRAMKLLPPGGCLITCSCSYNVDDGLFDEIVTSAAADAKAEMVLVERRLQARDHPTLLTVPETGYLKCLVLRKAR